MRFTVEHPVGQHGCSPELNQKEGLAAFLRTAEEVGFDTVGLTEHPAPSLKWLHADGHETLDSLSALAFAAAVTDRISLMTYLLVLPYRNPFLTAKVAATVDLLSRGRLVLGAGGGYLRSEFLALGVDFEERGALFDEALDVLRGLWQEESFTYTGRHFSARAQVSVPAPIQRPHPPIWIGGNSGAALRRVVRAGDGWTPLMISEQVAATTRMPAIDSVSKLAAAIDELRGMLVEAGRDPATVRIQVQGPQSDLLVKRQHSWEEMHDWLGELAAIGVTDVVVRTPGTSVQSALDGMAEFAGEVLATRGK